MFPFNQIVFGTLAYLISYHQNRLEQIDKRESFPCKIEDILKSSYSYKEYDYIVVGSGSAGSVVANRLSQTHSVLLLEVGGDQNPITEVPAHYLWLHTNPELIHEWTATKQMFSSFGINDGHPKVQQGKAVGGTSTINGMVYNRGNPHDYDYWAEITGDPSWSYENILKYFKMIENFHTEDDYNGHLGKSGLLFLSKHTDALDPVQTTWLESWKKAGQELGYKTFENSNSPQIEGFGHVSESKRFGRRYSANAAFLRPFKSRETLTISKYSEVTEIDLDDYNRAVGVKYLKHGVQRYAKARNEIIISAGTLNSPLILMRSGIGPEYQLKEAGIKVRADLPVGKSFQDHPIINWEFAYPENVPYKNLSQSDIDNYTENGKGPLTNIFGLFAQAFFQTKVAKKDPIHSGKNWPDVQIIALFKSKELFDGPGALNFLISLGLPKSRGSVRLNTTHPSSKLIWDPNYLAEKQDVDAMVEGMEMVEKILETDAFKPLNLRFDKTPYEGCKSLKFGTNEYRECFIRHMSKTHWHIVGTNPMGNPDDPNTVVDTRLRVKGVKGLRVIDNSIQPFMTNANTQAPAMMIGQKGAEMVLEDAILL